MQAFRLAPLADGSYSVEFSAPGFARRTFNTAIAAGRTSRIDATLELGQIFSTVEVVAPKPAAAPNPSLSPTATQRGPITLGGAVRASRLIKNSQPVYPLDLKQQGVEGTVILRATISADGVPLNVHVLNDDEVDARLAKAAVEAVEQWRYEPTTLNAQAVSVQTTIEVDFRLSQ